MNWRKFWAVLQWVKQLVTKRSGYCSNANVSLQIIICLVCFLPGLVWLIVFISLSKQNNNRIDIVYCCCWGWWCWSIPVLQKIIKDRSKTCNYGSYSFILLSIFSWAWLWRTFAFLSIMLMLVHVICICWKGSGDH